jgi:23S rRNA (uracil1939-C5)-methyltransferase
MLTRGQTISLTLDKPAAGGRMIGRVDGQVVLVSGAVPGERVRARIERVGKGVAYGETVVVDEPSTDRREGLADPLCGGCLYGHIAYPRQLEIKSQVIADAFTRIGRLALPAPVRVAGSAEDGYRMRARLHVRGDRLGFFREGTHEVCDARLTRQLLPATCDALDRLAAALQSLGVEAVREVELAENVDASDRVVYLDAASAIEARTLDRLAATEGLTGLATAFGVHGSAHVTDRLAVGAFPAVAFRRHVLAFFQGNRHLLGTLVMHVVDQVPAEGEVVDLYAGVGLFAISAAAARGVRVTAIEGDRYAAADLEVNAAGAGGSVVCVHQSVERFVGVGDAGGVRRPSDRRAGTVIVDPPRTGMSREALDGMLRLGASRLIYVSCDVATLARDSRRIVDAGYAIDRADAFDLFPNTPHVETVVVFNEIRGI